MSVYGRIVKVIGIVLGVSSVLAGVSIGGSGSGSAFFGVVAGIGGAFFGVVLHATGTVIAAMGEGLLALADIATNTAPDDRG